MIDLKDKYLYLAVCNMVDGKTGCYLTGTYPLSLSSLSDARKTLDT